MKSESEICKKELKDKVARLAKTVKELKPYRGMSLEYSMSMVEPIMYVANIHALKEFMMDRNCQGEKPRFMTESTAINPETGGPEDRWYLPINGPGGKYYQEMLDTLKKQQFIPDNSTLEDYDFLFDRSRSEIEQEQVSK
jgi:hypothetical protein